MDELVKKLSTGSHPVEVDLRPERTPAALKRSLENGYVLVKFTGTRGGTVLGFKVTADSMDLSKADFAAGCGQLRIWGDLSLNYTKVTCIAEIDLESLTGSGRLQPLDAGTAAV